MLTIVLAGGIALIGTLFGTPWAIRLFSRLGYGQLIRDDGPTSHRTKRGTPTMGGVVIVLSVMLGYACSHLILWSMPTWSGVLVLLLAGGLGLVGFVDDLLKIRNQRSLGLRSRAKLIGQAVVAIVFAVLALRLPDAQGITPASRFISGLRDIDRLGGAQLPALPLVVAVIWIVIMVAASSNGLNLVDGQDGLAAGCSVMVFGAYGLINIWQFNQSCLRSQSVNCYVVRDPHDLAAVAIALAAACFGFLWWNGKPAKIIMGDTGSLALGGAMAALAVFTRTELLLLLIGGVMVIDTLSVILQVGFFKATGGSRMFPMAPLHHTFEVLGWREVTVTIRFWILEGLFVSAGLALFYLPWVAGS